MTHKQFQTIVEQYERLIFTVCYQMVNDYQEAQNLTQETFLSAYMHIHQFEGNDIKPWLVRIASNKTKDFLKSAYNKRVVTAQEQLPEEIAKETPHELYLQQERVDEIYQCIDGLKQPYKEVGILYFKEEKTEAEISLLLNRPIRTVQTQIYRCKQKLRKLIKEV